MFRVSSYSPGVPVSANVPLLDEILLLELTVTFSSRYARAVVQVEHRVARILPDVITSRVWVYSKDIPMTIKGFTRGGAVCLLLVLNNPHSLGLATPLVAGPSKYQDPTRLHSQRHRYRKCHCLFLAHDTSLCHEYLTQQQEQ